MKLAMTAAVLIAALAGARVSGGDASVDDLKKLQGTWQLVTKDGKAPSKEEAKARLVIDGNKATAFVGQKKTLEWTLKLDASKQPKHIDLTPAGKTAGPKTSMLGIYVLDGDTFRFVAGSTFKYRGDFVEVVPSQRPKDFDKTSEPVSLLKRVKD